ncbi:MAG: hypothetical protein RIR39_1909 [Pseudomonadota bacterium]
MLLAGLRPRHLGGKERSAITRTSDYCFIGRGLGKGFRPLPNLWLHSREMFPYCLLKRSAVTRESQQPRQSCAKQPHRCWNGHYLNLAVDIVDIDRHCTWRNKTDIETIVA